MSENSNHRSKHLVRQPILSLLAALITESDDALPEFSRWCEEHMDIVEAIASCEGHMAIPASGVATFQETLVFVRMQLDMLEATRTTTGLTEAEQHRYEGLREMEIDLIARTSGPV